MTEPHIAAPVCIIGLLSSFAFGWAAVAVGEWLGKKGS